jgi:hypothetical protein
VSEAEESDMLRVIIALLLFAHGIGHVMGPLKVLGVATVNPAWHGDSWLLGWAGQSLTSVIGVAVWSAALVGFVALAAVVIGWLPAAWWAPLGITSSVISLTGLVLFPIAFPPISTIGAAVVDVGVLVAVFWLHWTPAEALS